MNPPALTATELLAKWKHVLDQDAHIFTWTSGHELSWLCDCASRASFIIEIGSFYGKSALCMALANPEAHIICIDTCENDQVEERFAKNLAAQIKAGKMTFVKGTSADLESLEYSKASFGFVDAGHLFEDVSTDIANLLPHMAPGAILSGHDWRHNDMNDGVNRGVLAHFKLEELRFHESIWYVKLP